MLLLCARVWRVLRCADRLHDGLRVRDDGLRVVDSLLLLHDGLHVLRLLGLHHWLHGRDRLNQDRLLESAAEAVAATGHGNREQNGQNDGHEEEARHRDEGEGRGGEGRVGSYTRVGEKREKRTAAVGTRARQQQKRQSGQAHQRWRFPLRLPLVCSLALLFACAVCAVCVFLTFVRIVQYGRVIVALLRSSRFVAPTRFPLRLWKQPTRRLGRAPRPLSPVHSLGQEGRAGREGDNTMQQAEAD